MMGRLAEGTQLVGLDLRQCRRQQCALRLLDQSHFFFKNLPLFQGLEHVQLFKHVGCFQGEFAEDLLVQTERACIVLVLSR